MLSTDTRTRQVTSCVVIDRLRVRYSKKRQPSLSLAYDPSAALAETAIALIPPIQEADMLQDNSELHKSLTCGHL